MTTQRVCRTAYAYRRHSGPYAGTTELLGPQTAGIGGRPPEALHRQVARSLQSMAMFENAIRTSARRLQQNAELMRIWLLVNVKERVPELIGAVSDLLRRCLAVSVR
jgi:hypothetical protein